MSPNLKVVQSDIARQRQAMRDLDGLPWAAEKTQSFSVKLSKAMVLVGLPIAVAVRVAVWAGWL